jgi:hypothetical protein
VEPDRGNNRATKFRREVFGWPSGGPLEQGVRRTVGQVTHVARGTRGESNCDLVLPIRSPHEFRRRCCGNMGQYLVVCSSIGATKRSHSDKLASYLCCLLSCMTPRQPRLDWIKEVLADLAADGERAPAQCDLVRQRATASVSARSMDDPLELPDREDRLVCPSWQLIRLAVTRIP